MWYTQNMKLTAKIKLNPSEEQRLLLKESRFVNDVNHCVSKAIVKKAKRTEHGIALEDLTGIRERVWIRKPQRTQLHSWSFADLGSKIAYKAEMYGVPVVYVDPRNTSR